VLVTVHETGKCRPVIDPEALQKFATSTKKPRMPPEMNIVRAADSELAVVVNVVVVQGLWNTIPNRPRVCGNDGIVQNVLAVSASLAPFLGQLVELITHSYFPWLPFGTCLL